MNITPVTTLEVALRAARPDDVDVIAAIWHAGWADGHAGHVPAGLADHRKPVDLARLAAQRIETTTVAVTGVGPDDDDDGIVVGFVTVHGDEVEQVYVAPSARGTGAVTPLLGAGEAAIASGHAAAWLAVVAGNTRARRCYERHGWHDAGAFSYAAETADGPFTVPAHRYVKSLTERSPR